MSYSVSGKHIHSISRNESCLLLRSSLAKTFLNSVCLAYTDVLEYILTTSDFSESKGNYATTFYCSFDVE